MELFSSSSGICQIQSALSFSQLIDFSGSCIQLSSGQINHYSFFNRRMPSSQLTAYYFLDLKDMWQVKNLGFPFLCVPEGAGTTMDLPRHGKCCMVCNKEKRLQPQYLILVCGEQEELSAVQLFPPYQIGCLSLPCQEHKCYV